MITYVLCGGNERACANFGERFTDFIYKNIKKPRILDVFFSRPHETWQEYFDDWTSFYKKYFKEFTRENANLENFNEQISQNDVIFFLGGSTEEIMKNLTEFRENLPKLFCDKIIVGSSAGANFLASGFLEHSNQDFRKGFGILPINIVVHYQSGNLRDARDKAGVKTLIDKSPNLPTVLLREGEFVIFTEENE
jgi:cyanophycinase-like exopeptidase